MSANRKAKAVEPPTAAPTQRERAKALRQRAAHPQPVAKPTIPDPAEPDPIFGLIEEHKRRSAAFRANDGTDDNGDHEAAAFDALEAGTPMTLAGLKALADYVSVFDTMHHAGPRPDRPLEPIALEALHGAVLRYCATEEASADRQARALVDALEAEWARYARAGIHTDNYRGPDADVRLDRECQRMDELLDAADKLPAASREARHAKALALAWIDFVTCWQRDKARSDYALDGRLALDIEAGIRGAVSAPRRPACEAERIGLLIAKNGAEILRLDAEGANNGPSPLAVEFRWADERGSKLCEALSYARARSPGGMLAQVAVAGYQLGAIYCGTSDKIKKRAHDNAERCLFSVAAAIARLHGIDREGFCADRYLSATLDPLSILDTDPTKA